MEHFEKFQALAIITYFILLEEGEGKLEASENACRYVYVSEFHNGKDIEGSYKSRLIRIWGDLFLETGMNTKHIYINSTIFYTHI
jgi:hypothetical protein